MSPLGVRSRPFPVIPTIDWSEALIKAETQLGTIKINGTMLTGLSTKDGVVIIGKGGRERAVGDIYKEKAIRYKNNLRYIDLLVYSQKEELWNVIDYKSSLSYSDHHLKQVRYYNKAILEITGQKVQGYICYLLSDSIKLVKIKA
jgi:hypothetical protein